MGYDFYQVQFCVLGCLHCLFYRNDAHLLSICADQSDFDDCDVTIQAVSFVLFGDSLCPLLNLYQYVCQPAQRLSPGADAEQDKPFITFVTRQYADVRQILPGSSSPDLLHYGCVQPHYGFPSHDHLPPIGKGYVAMCARGF